MLRLVCVCRSRSSRNTESLSPSYLFEVFVHGFLDLFDRRCAATLRARFIFFIPHLTLSSALLFQKYHLLGTGLDSNIKKFKMHAHSRLVHGHRKRLQDLVKIGKLELDGENLDLASVVAVARYVHYLYSISLATGKTSCSPIEAMVFCPN